MAGRPRSRLVMTVSGLAVLLSSCSFEYEVTAEIRQGTIYFSTRGGSGSWFAPDPCIDTFEIARGAELLWSIERINTRADCTDDFPLAYGAPPPGFQTLVAPRALRPGEVYEIRGYGRVIYSGSFRYPAGAAPSAGSPTPASRAR